MEGAFAVGWFLDENQQTHQVGSVMSGSATMQQVGAARGGRPSPAESEQISRRILEAARALFLRDGFAQTSMDAIAATIGISKRTLYSRHKSKAALFEAMVVDVVTSCTSQIVTNDLEAGSLRKQLLTLSKRVLAVVTDPLIISLERVVTGESRQFPHLAELIRHHGGLPLQRAVADILRDFATASPDVERDADIFLGIVVLPFLRHAVLQLTKPGIDGIDRAQLERTVDIFITGIGGARSCTGT